MKKTNSCCSCRRRCHIPIYQYRCGNGHQFDRFYTVKDHDSAVSCEVCDLVAQQVISAPLSVRVKADLCYDSPIDGKPVTTWAAREDDLKRSGCIPYDPEMKKDAERIQHQRQADFDAKVETTVCETIARMPEKKKRQLKHELVNQGADVEIRRSAC